MHVDVMALDPKARCVPPPQVLHLLGVVMLHGMWYHAVLLQVSLDLQHRCIRMSVEGGAYRLLLRFTHICGAVQLGTSDKTGGVRWGQEESGWVRWGQVGSGGVRLGQVGSGSVSAREVLLSHPCHL
jgi:hypothetical protein